MLPKTQCLYKQRENDSYESWLKNERFGQKNMVIPDFQFFNIFKFHDNGSHHQCFVFTELPWLRNNCIFKVISKQKIIA